MAKKPNFNDATDIISAVIDPIISPLDSEVQKEPEEEVIEMTRNTFALSVYHDESLSNLAYWTRIDKQDLLAEAFEDLFLKYEKKRGPLEPRPEKKKKRKRINRRRD